MDALDRQGNVAAGGIRREIFSATIALGKNLLVQTDKGELVLVAADPAQIYRT